MVVIKGVKVEKIVSHQLGVPRAMEMPVDRYRYKDLLETCPRGNTEVVIIIFPC